MLNRRRQIGLYKTRDYGRITRSQCHNNRVMLEKTPIICIKCETSFQSHDAFLEHFTKGQCDHGVQHFAGDASGVHNVHEESSESILPICEADSEDESRKSPPKSSKENVEDITCQSELTDEEPGFLPLLVKLEEIDEPYDGSCVKNIAADNALSELACDNEENGDEIITAHNSSSPSPVPSKLQIINKGMFHQNGQIAIPVIGQTYSCKECGKTFCSKEKLDIHVQIHSSSTNNMFVCNFCNESFKFECYLRVHQQQHTPCEICGAIFKSRVALKVHKQVHQQDRSMKCKTCGLAYRTKANLARHESSHLKQKLAS